MMSVAWRRADDIIATRARRIACTVNAVIDHLLGRLRIWRIVSSGDAWFLRGRVVKEKFNNTAQLTLG